MIVKRTCNRVRIETEDGAIVIDIEELRRWLPTLQDVCDYNLLAKSWEDIDWHKVSERR